MITFIIGLVILVVGSALYGKLCDKIFQPDDRQTPAYAKQDGVDFVPMKHWKNMLINLLNIAGTGPILGPIQGILFGPIAFITIPIGNVIAGATHDYLTGMVMMRDGGIQVPQMVRKYSNRVVHIIFFVFCSLLLLLVGAVFIYTPGDILAKQVLGFSASPSAVSTWVIYGAIFAYYLLATCFPIDKIIGRVYPIFGLILLFSAVGIFFSLFFTGSLSEIGEVWEEWNMPAFAYGDYFRNGHFFPVMFITVACGILSGFHSTQVAIVSRTIEHEKQLKSVSYCMMTTEGFIAMCWAAGAMVVYNTGAAQPNPSLATDTVGIICRTLLGPVGGVIALIGVIVLPITSGDTALRSLRISLAEFAHFDQKPLKNRLALCIPIFMLTAAILIWSKTNADGFNILWRYFAWSNQTISLFAFLAVIVWMFETKRQKFVWVPFIPACFYTFITVTFIVNAQIGFGQPWPVAYAIGIIAAVAYLVILLWYGNKRAKRLQNAPLEA